MLVSGSSTSRGGAAVALLLLSIKALLLQHHQHLLLVSSQALDGDDQFQAYHQDIGRISGGAKPAAGASVIRQLQQPAAGATTAQRSGVASGRRPTSSAAAAAAPASGAARASSRTQTPRLRFSQQQPATPASAPSLDHTTTGDFGGPASLQPTFTQLSAPPQRALFQQLTAAPEPAARASSLVVMRPALPAVVAAAAQASSGSLRSSVSARHSALMAQVAAEREAAFTPGRDELLPAAAPQPPAAASGLAPQIAAASQPAPSQFVDQAEEPLAAPSFDQVLNHGCPHKGVYSFPNKDYCDRYYICTNGTFTEETCPNGLAYGTQGAVYHHCAYNWNIDCAHKKAPEAISSPGCPWQFGIFPVSGAGKCSLDYSVCEWGVPERKRCHPEGLFYDDRIKGCQWADQLGCKSEQVLNFKCPAEDEDNPYWPYPRYYHTKQDVVVCVNEQPRLVHCNEDQIVDPGSLACMDLYKNKRKSKPKGFRS